MSKSVEVELGFTKSMGAGTYEFLRVDIRHRDDVLPDETHDEVTDRIYEALSSKLVEKVNQIDEDLGASASESRIHAKEK